MTLDYVHGYDSRESLRLQDQAATLAELLHSDTVFPAGSRVLEAGCGVGAQTVTLAKNSPGARVLAVDISSDSLAEAERAVRAPGLTNVELRQVDVLTENHVPYRVLVLCAVASVRKIFRHPRVSFVGSVFSGRWL